MRCVDAMCGALCGCSVWMYMCGRMHVPQAPPTPTSMPTRSHTRRIHFPASPSPLPFPPHTDIYVHTSTFNFFHQCITLHILIFSPMHYTTRMVWVPTPSPMRLGILLPRTGVHAVNSKFTVSYDRVPTALHWPIANGALYHRRHCRRRTLHVIGPEPALQTDNFICPLVAASSRPLI